MIAGIGLFEVDGKDNVRKYNDADALTVFKYRSKIEGQPPAFLQCGGFVYPLLPGKSPILKSGDKTYAFPELRSEGEERKRGREGGREGGKEGGREGKEGGGGGRDVLISCRWNYSGCGFGLCISCPNCSAGPAAE